MDAALAVNGLGEVGAFVYDGAGPATGFLGLGELRQEPVCPWPSVFTHEPYAISNFVAKSGGTVMNQGDAPVSQRGVCWSTNTEPTTTDNVKAEGGGPGKFHAAVTGLNVGTVYFLRAYARNEFGTTYGKEYSFRAYPEPR
jgi:hypothetical protein